LFISSYLNELFWTKVKVHLIFQNALLHCKNEYAISNVAKKKKCGNRLQAKLLIKFNKIRIE